MDDGTANLLWGVSKQHLRQQQRSPFSARSIAGWLIAPLGLLFFLFFFFNFTKACTERQKHIHLLRSPKPAPAWQVDNRHQAPEYLASAWPDCLTMNW